MKYGRDKYIFKTYPPIILAYLAGIIDGEGSISAGSYAFTKVGTPQFTTYLSVTSTDKVLVEWLSENFGGKFHAYKKSQIAHNSTRLPYRWQITGNRLLDICNQVLPFMVIKGKQIEIMIKMRNTFNKRSYMNTRRGAILSSDLIEYRFALVKELRSCHIRTSSIKHNLD